MTRKSGLHKKVSSIFGDSAIPGNSPLENPPGPGTANGSGDRSRFNGGRSSKASSRPSPVYDEEKEFEAAQRKKLILAGILVMVLGVVVYFLYLQPKPKTTIAAKPEKTDTKTPIRASLISWPDPGEWPSDIKDPMAIKGGSGGGGITPPPPPGKLELRGIISGSLALIGTEIFKVGEKCEDWTVKEILKGSVILEKPDGEKRVLKMPDKNRDS